MQGLSTLLRYPLALTGQWGYGKEGESELVGTEMNHMEQKCLL